MSNHANAILDATSMPIPVSALPATGEAATYHNEKDMVLGSSAGQDVSVSPAVALDDGDEEPTEEEYATLRKIPAPMTWTSIAMCAIEFSERASYIGCQQLFANFIRGPLPPGGNGAGAVAPGAAGENQSAGALGMGSVAATAVGSTITFTSYLIPIYGGIVADSQLGRFKTIAIGVCIGIVSHALLIIPAAPKIIAGGHAFPAFMISVLILCFATGFIKPSLGPLLCDQSPVKRPVIRTTKKGERVILDPQATVTRYLLVFYMAINIGGLFAIATSYSERLVGFWLAWLLPGIVYCFCPIILLICYKKLYLAPPQGSVTLEALRVFKELFKRAGWRVFKGGDEMWNAVKPSVIEARDGTIDRTKILWDDLFVDEIRQSVSACAVTFLIPIFNLADGGLGNSENSMSAAMTLSGVPNDVINNFNPLTIIIATPMITWGLYPFFERIGHPLKPMTRMSIGYVLGAINMVAGAIMQWRVYKTSPCGYYATDCELGVSPVSLLWQIILYSLPAIGEIFINVTAYELAYTRAPARMKGLVYALCLFNQSISSAIALALSNVVQDPYLIWSYVALAIACAICAVICPTYFRYLNANMRSFADPDRQAGKMQPGNMPVLNNSQTGTLQGSIEDVDSKEKA